MKTIEDFSNTSCSFLVHLYFTNSYWYNNLSSVARAGGARSLKQTVLECQKWVKGCSTYKLNNSHYFEMCCIFNLGLLPIISFTPLSYPSMKSLSDEFDKTS